MKGLKVRVPKNKVMIQTFKAFGAEPIPLAWSETPDRTADRRTIDGGDNGTSVIKDMKFYEFTKHLVILDHFAGVAPLFASDRMMRKLKPDQVAAIRRAAEEAGQLPDARCRPRRPSRSAQMAGRERRHADDAARIEPRSSPQPYCRSRTSSPPRRGPSSRTCWT